MEAFLESTSDVPVGKSVLGKQGVTLDLELKNVFSPWDKTSFTACVIVLLVASLVAAFSTKEGLSGFYLANRKLTFLPMAASMFMSNIGSAHFVGVAGFASSTGIGGYAYELSATVALTFLGWIFLPVYIASGSVTTIDYLKKRYGGKRIEIYLSVLTLILIVFTKSSVELFSAYQVVQTLFRDVDEWSVTITVLLVAMFITGSGGLHAVVYTDSVQALILLIGGSFISYYCLSKFESYDELKVKYFEAWPNTSKLHFGENSSYPYTYCGIPASTSWNIIRSYKNTELPWPGMFFGITISSIWYWCCDQMIVQVGLGARNIVEAKYACLLAAYAKILTFFFLILPGLVSRVLYTDTVACADPDVCEGICELRGGCSNLAFPSIFMDVVAPDFRGMVLAAVMAGCVSSVTSCLNSGSTIFTVNVYHNVRPLATELELLLITKAAVVTLGVASLFWVKIIHHFPELWNYMQEVTSTLAPPIVAIYVCAMFWERATEQSAFFALMLGLGLGGVRAVWTLVYPVVPCGEEISSVMPDILTHFHFLHFGIFNFVLCVIYIVISGLFSEPIGVVHLYRLLYWLRHSKLDRVDINELDVAYKRLVSKQGKEQTEKTLVQMEGQQNGIVEKITVPRGGLLRGMCCVEPSLAAHLMTDSEMRETFKHKASIEEAPRQSKTLNLHVVLLLIISAVVWGFFS